MRKDKDGRNLLSFGYPVYESDTIDFLDAMRSFMVHDYVEVIESYGIKYENVDIHALDLPDYYGCNWDAFWDCLTNMVGRPIHIEIIGLDVIERKFDDAAKTMIDTLREFKHYEDDEFVNDIKIEIVNGDTCTVIC